MTSQGKKKILEVVADIANVERSFGLDTSVEEYQNEFKFGLIEVVYEWAKGEVSELNTNIVFNYGIQYSVN